MSEASKKAPSSCHLDRAVHGPLPRDDRRWSLRRGIKLDADVTDSVGNRFAATVTDISEEGFCIRTNLDRKLLRDSLHTIKVTGHEPLTGYVIWSSQGKTGFAFGEPLHQSTVQGLVVKSLYSRLSRRLGRQGPGDRIENLPPFPFD